MFICILQHFRNIKNLSFFFCYSTLDTRILNDLLMDLDRILLCPDKQYQSKTDWIKFFKLNHEPFNIILMYINEIIKCYENAIQFLQDQ